MRLATMCWGQWHAITDRSVVKFGRISADVCVFEDKIRSVVSFKRNAKWYTSSQRSLLLQAKACICGDLARDSYSIVGSHLSDLLHNFTVLAQLIHQADSDAIADAVWWNFVFRLKILILMTSAAGVLPTFQMETAFLSNACLGLSARSFV
jgi:hypothetical protein